MEYAIKLRTTESIDAIEPKVREALAENGFGILTEIDVQATLKKKIDVDRPPYKILGACNPGLANKGIAEEPDLGVLLPCNVCLYEDERGVTVVSAMKPTTALGIIDNPALGPIADEAERAIVQAIERAVPVEARAT